MIAVLKCSNDIVLINEIKAEIAMPDNDWKIWPDSKALFESISICAENLEIETAW